MCATKRDWYDAAQTYLARTHHVDIIKLTIIIHAIACVNLFNYSELLQMKRLKTKSGFDSAKERINARITICSSSSIAKQRSLHCRFAYLVFTMMTVRLLAQKRKRIFRKLSKIALYFQRYLLFIPFLQLVFFPSISVRWNFSLETLTISFDWRTRIDGVTEFLFAFGH